MVTCNKDNDEKGGGEDTLTSLLLTINMYIRHNSLIIPERRQKRKLDEVSPTNAS